ncbi:MAG: hypothetical protein HY674_10590 [Chloroflexi bacterium]|nr:hypothetical protein [Chloroflexota bacterium]
MKIATRNVWILADVPHSELRIPHSSVRAVNETGPGAFGESVQAVVG